MPIPPKVERPASARRIVAVDAARGFAMTLVCANHIKPHFEATAPNIYWLVLSTTRIATPVFLLLSGFVIRYLMRTSSRGNVRVTLLDRALFLLLVAHPLLGLEDIGELGPMHWMFARTEITDAVGVALIVAVLMRNAPASLCLVLGVSLCFLSWIVAVTVTPETSWGQVLGSVLFLVRSVDNVAIDAPIVAYVGIFLIGMALNGRLEKPLLEGNTAQISRYLLKCGASAVVAALCAVLAWHFVKDQVQTLLHDPHATALFREALDPRSKRPPSPGYFLFYSGAGLLLLALFFHGRPAALFRPAMERFAVLGRASLMCFVVQDWLLNGVVKVLGLNSIHSVAFWFTYLGACLVALYFLARRWEAARGNRFLTVGLKALISRREKSRQGYAGDPSVGDSRRAAG